MAGTGLVTDPTLITCAGAYHWLIHPGMLIQTQGDCLLRAYPCARPAVTAEVFVQNFLNGLPHLITSGITIRQNEISDQVAVNQSLLFRGGAIFQKVRPYKFLVMQYFL